MSVKWAGGLASHGLASSRKVKGVDLARA